MKSAILAFLLFGYLVSSEDPGCGDITAEQDCDDFADLGNDCEWDGSNCVYEEDPTDAPETTEEVDCDEDLDMRNWAVQYIGKSTQFRIYDPCGSKFIKFKMEDLTEYDSEDKRTTNRETSFASIKDWSHTPSATENMFTNVFEANALSKSDASFTLKTEFFREDVEDYPNKWYNGTVTVERNSLKFSVNISNFIVTDGGYAVLCVNIMTNGAGDFDLEDGEDTDVYSNGEFSIDNDLVAQCDVNGDVSDINVAVDVGGNGNNQIDLCYTFDECAGDIVYDPLIELMDTDGSYVVSVVMVFVLSAVGVLFV